MTVDCLNAIKARFGEDTIKEQPLFAVPPEMLQPNNNFMQLPVLEGEEESDTDTAFDPYEDPNYEDDDDYYDYDDYSDGDDDDDMEYFDNDHYDSDVSQ